MSFLTKNIDSRPFTWSLLGAFLALLAYGLLSSAFAEIPKQSTDMFRPGAFKQEELWLGSILAFSSICSFVYAFLPDNKNQNIQLIKNLIGSCGFFGLIALFGAFALLFWAFYSIRHGFG
jgi:hypothetical protein